MSEARKGKKQNPFQGRLEAQLKSKSASLPTPLDYGGAGNAVKGRDERQLRAPLTAFPAPVPPSVLTTAVVVIHGMTTWSDCGEREFLARGKRPSEALGVRHLFRVGKERSSPTSSIAQPSSCGYDNVNSRRGLDFQFRNCCS